MIYELPFCMNEEPIKALVTKSNNLVEARYHFSIWETRVFTKLVSLIHPDDENFKKYKLQIRDLVNFFGVNDNDAYEKIKAVPDNLLKKVVTIPYTENGEERFLKTGLIAQATIPKKKEGYIEISFHPDLKPYLLQLKRTFLSYDIRNVLKISSVYSVRIYELLKQYEKIGYREFDIDTLKVILGVSDKYKLYGHFKSRVIIKAQEDLKQHTDICFDFKEVKTSRRVTAIFFEIKKNKNIETIEDENNLLKISEETATIQQEVEDRLLDWGISKKTLNSYLKNYSIEHLKIRIQYVINQQNTKAHREEKIDNLAAYFNSVVSKEDLVDYVEDEKTVQKNKKAKIKNSAEQKKILEERLKLVKRELESKEQDYVYSLFDQEPKMRADVLQKVRSNTPLFYSDVEKSNEDYFETNPLFRAAAFTIIKENYKKDFVAIRKNYEGQIKQLELELRSL